MLDERSRNDQRSEAPRVPQSLDECIATLRYIVAICQRAGLHRAAFYLDGVREFIEAKCK